MSVNVGNEAPRLMVVELESQMMLMITKLLVTRVVPPVIVVFTLNLID